MAIWQFTLNNNPARDGSDNVINTFNDGTGAFPGDANFANGERLAAAQLAMLGASADGMRIAAYTGTNSYVRASGTHTFKA